MSEIDLQRAIRYERKRKKLNGQHCIACGETDIRCLQLVTLCAKCRLTVQGLPTVEEHHVVGRENDPLTVALPANEHAIISDMGIEYTSKKTNNEFLIWLRAFRDILERLIELTDEGISILEGDDE